MAFPNHFAAATAETHKRLREIREMRSIAGQAVDRLVETAMSYPADTHETYFQANGENYRIRIERIHDSGVRRKAKHDDGDCKGPCAGNCGEC